MEAAVRWSPHSTGDRRRFLLVDVAESSLTLNEVDSDGPDGSKIKHHRVAYHGKLPSFAAFDWSRTDESLVAVGLVSGNASLVKLSEGNEPSEVVTTFRIKQQRKCNSIAFSTENWLAVALDKTRSDVCLNIYDAGANPGTQNDPIRRLCPAELVSSVRFFPRQPQELVLAAQRSFIRLYDLRDPHGNSGANMQAATRNVNNIAIDPMDENYFASAGSTDDPSVTVWDKRWIAHGAGASNTGAVYDFRPAVDSSLRTSVWSLRYSGQQRGRLAVCSSTGELKIIDMVEGRTHLSQSSGYNLPFNPFGGSHWTTNRYVSESKSLEHPWHDAKDGRPSNSRIVAFDWLQDRSASMDQGLLVLRPNRSVDILRVPTDKPLAEVTPRNELSLALKDLSLTEPKPVTDLAQLGSTYEQRHGASEAEDFGPLAYSGELNTEEEITVPVCAPSDPQITSLLAPGTIGRERCRRGYLFDCRKNMEIAAGNWQLERLWEIVGRFQEQAAGNGMVYDALDLSYVGVTGLWSESPGHSPNRFLSPAPTKPEDALIGLTEDKHIPSFEGERTDFPEHRQMCLLVCGWKFTVETLEAECQELIDRGFYYQAIVQAVLHGYRNMALNLLRTLIRSKTIPNIGLGALLASDEINEAQREMCMWMSADTDDPALKALLTFLTNGDWRDVMKTNYLHLGYRVALGLRYLNDTELSGFIQSETARAIRNGDLEGILLTGLGSQAMDLLQTYITRTNDLQTAVLASAFTNPLYVDDVRWEMWRETYFQQMQTWRTFNERTKFVVQHNRLARTREGSSTIDKIPAQVALKCAHCQGSLARNDNPVHSHGSHGSSSNKQPKVKGPAANAGTVCLKCGRHMPRCAICALWLGTPDLRKRAMKKELVLGSGEGEDGMARFLSFCVACGHGYHADHALRWFEGHDVCAVPDCGCSCGLKR